MVQKTNRVLDFCLWVFNAWVAVSDNGTVRMLDLVLGLSCIMVTFFLPVSPLKFLTVIAFLVTLTVPFLINLYRPIQCEKLANP